MNKHMTVGMLAATLIAVLSLATAADARVIEIQITSVESPTFAGRSFGNVGQYEKLRGTATLEVDPKDPHNSNITDVNLAPKTPRGKVRWSTDILILKPVDMSRGNHKIFFEVNNRGNLLALSFAFNDAKTGGNNPGSAASDAGNGFLFEQGYTLIWAGWEGDVLPGNSRLIDRVPVAKNPDGSSITGKLRQEYSDVASGTFTLPLSGSPAFVSYESVTTDNTQALLTVRTHDTDPKVPVPSNQWAFGTCPTGQASLVPNTTNFCYFPGFSPDKLYELSWTAKDPLVMGLAFPVTRDVASFFRYSAKDDSNNSNPLAGAITKAYVWGASQSGAYIRDWLYQGYNEDEQGREVFDAAWADIGAAVRTFANVRFLQENDFSRQDQWHDYLQNAIFPFQWAVTTDPITGRTDGILKRPATDPNVFATNHGEEYRWGQNSLTYISGDGKKPLQIPHNVREYDYSSMPHGSSYPSPVSRGICKNFVNQGPGIKALNRALLVALDDWEAKGIEPPQSRLASLGQLIEPDKFCAQFPAIPGFTCTNLVNELTTLDFGPEFTPIGGIMTNNPPILGASYTVLVPRTDRVGNDVDGLESTYIMAPIATYTGWNVRAAGHREGDLCSLNGSYAPLSNTRAEAQASGDSRPSLEELYHDHAGYVKAVSNAAHVLQVQRFLLPTDAQQAIQEAEDSNVLK